MYRLFSALAHAGERPVGRVILLTLGLLGALFFLLPLMFRIVNVGNAFGFCASAFLLAFALFGGPLHSLLDRAGQSGIWRWILNILAFLLCAGILYCMVLTGLMLHAAHKKPSGEPQAVIVLGCKVNGTEPSLMLWRRIQAAKAALDAHPEMLAVVSGGQGSNEEISEAQCMAEELISLGIAPERILREDKSTTTSENLRFSKKILEECGIDGQLLIATDSFHEKRAQVLAKMEGLPDCAAVSAKTSWYLVPTYWVREWFGLTHAFVFGD